MSFLIYQAFNIDPLMLSFKHQRQKVFGTETSFHHMDNSNESRSRFISFKTVKQADKNYKAMFPQAKKEKKKRDLPMQSPFQSPVRRPVLGKQNISSNRSRRQDCSKFTLLLQKKGFSSAGKKAVPRSFGDLVKQNNLGSDRQFNNSRNKKYNLLSDRQMRSQTSLVYKIGEVNPILRKQQETEYIEFDSLLSEIEWAGNPSEEEESFGLGIV